MALPAYSRLGSILCMLLWRLGCLPSLFSLRRLPWLPASSDHGSEKSFFSCFPWWRGEEEGGSGRRSPNKLDFRPNRVRILWVVRFSSCCHGGRREKKNLLDLAFVLLFMCACLRACRLAMAGVCGLTAGPNRGVAPADEDSSVSRFRRSRRIAHAATSTRCTPLQVRSGDIAAACVAFVFHSGGATAAFRAAADLSVQSWSQGLGCNFLFFRVLSVNWGTAVLFLDTSCNFGFLA